MQRAVVILVVALCGLFLQAQAGDKPRDAIAEQRKAEILRKADALLGERYRPLIGEPLRLFDEESEWGPPDAVLYWHGSDYLVELVFATDGSLARVELLPEALLHVQSQRNAESLELLASQKQWLVDTSNQLQPVGSSTSETGGCWQSASLHCSDIYELASVSHEWLIERDEGFTAVKYSLIHVTVAYKRSVSGVVSDLKPIDGDERELKIGGTWYRIYKDDDESLFQEMAIGSFVHLITVGCSGNQKACDASPTSAFPTGQGSSSNHY